MEQIDLERIITYLEQLIAIPSPTGFTSRIEDYLINHARKNNIPFTHTKKGSLIFRFEASGGENLPNLMFASHIDTLGAMVKEIKGEVLKFTPIGSYPMMNIVGNYCRIHGYDERETEGTILPDNPAAHVNKKLAEMKMEPPNFHIRPDVVSTEDEPLTAYFDVGNFVSFDPQFRRINGFVKARHLDDKASAAILLHLADRLISRRDELNKNIYLYFNVTEETGQGIGGVPELDELIIVDMGVVGEGCAGSELAVSICAKDSSGPYNHQLTRTMVNLAKKEGLNYRIDIFPHYGSDASAFLGACNDVKAALIGPGVSASHGYERTGESALLNSARLIDAYIFHQNERPSE